MIMKENSRREFILRLSLLSLFAGTGCSTITKLALSYPEEYDTDAHLVESNLKAFASTVLPGVDVSDPNITRIFSDEYYPVYKIRGYFLHTLNKFTAKNYNRSQFYELKPDQREETIQSFLDGGGRKRRLFKIAILLVQTSFYSGIYDSNEGCDFIGFRGANYGFNTSEMYYSEVTDLVSDSITEDGNYS